MNKKKNKTPMMLRLVSWLFPKVERISPWIAKRWFVSIFFTPLRYKMPPPELDIINQASKYQIDYEGNKVQVYEWGDGIPILMVHGWMGRGAQFRKFIPAFNQAGFKVVSFDATGHGNSEGGKSHIMEFAGIVEKLASNYEFKMVIGHSIGGAASLHAILNQKFTNKLVMIGSPTIASKIVEEFMRRLNASEKVTGYFYDYVKATFGKPFEEYSASYIIKDLKHVDLLIIHDEDDVEVTIDNADVLLEKYPAAKFIKTQGMGHTRILKDESVIEACLSFAKGNIKAVA